MNQVKCCWGLNTLPQITTYLGVPLFLSKSKSQDFRYVKERLDSKLSRWKSKNLSWSGRATLIRSMAQAIPTYSMSAILFLKGFCDQLDASVRRFWWSPISKAGSYWTPMSWPSLCSPHKEAGLGFRKFWDFNQALLSKLGWWILFGKDCFCIKVLKAKYKILDNWLAHHSPSNASPFWKSMMGIKHLIAKAACLYSVMGIPLEHGQTYGFLISLASPLPLKLMLIWILLWWFLSSLLQTEAVGIFQS